MFRTLPDQDKFVIDLSLDGHVVMNTRWRDHFFSPAKHRGELEINGLFMVVV